MVFIFIRLENYPAVSPALPFIFLHTLSLASEKSSWLKIPSLPNLRWRNCLSQCAKIASLFRLTSQKYWLTFLTVRDKYDENKADLESQISKLLGTSFTLAISPNEVVAYVKEDSRVSIGGMFTS
jgi:hypothetical protein